MKLKIERYCSCGGAVTGSVAGYNPSEALEAIVGAFEKDHHGDGHAPCAAREAANARRRNEAATRREYARLWDEKYGNPMGAPATEEESHG